MILNYACKLFVSKIEKKDNVALLRNLCFFIKNFAHSSLHGENVYSSLPNSNIISDYVKLLGPFGNFNFLIITYYI